MFILKPQDVQLCSTIKKLKNQAQNFHSLFYRGYLFIQVASYPHKQLPVAIKKCRQLLELNNEIITIIVKTPSALTLWSHPPREKTSQVNNSIVPSNKQKLFDNNLESYEKWDSIASNFWQQIAQTNLTTGLKKTAQDKLDL